MNEDNAQFLKERLFFLGFGDNLHAEMEKKIAQKADQFQLSMQGEFKQGDAKKVVDYTVDFSRSKKEGSDMYFVNHYTASLKENDQERTQKFFLNNGAGVTAKEAFNLLEGRAVHKNKLTNKEGEEFSAWLQLNFKEQDKYGNNKVQQYHEAWNYKLEDKIGRLPIKELQNEEQKADLLKNLKKGNIQPVTFSKDGNDVRMYVEANPKERTINVYDEKLTKQFQGIRQPSKDKAQEEAKGAQMEKAEDSGKKQKAKPGNGDDDPPAGRTKRKGVKA